MFPEKRCLPAMLIVLTLGVVSVAQQGMAQDSAKAVEAKISADMVHAIKSRPKEALQVLMTYAFSCSDDGVVTAQNDAVARSILRSKQRIRLISPLLEMDLDADGHVSRAEFENYSRTQIARARAKSEERWLEVDTDGDGMMMLTEMLMSATRKLDQDEARKRGMQNIPKEIMQMDVDGDGRVTIDEIRAVVAAVSG